MDERYQLYTATRATQALDPNGQIPAIRLVRLAQAAADDIRGKVERTGGHMDPSEVLIDVRITYIRRIDG